MENKEEKKFNNLYAFKALEDGDVFYFAGDKKKKVYEFHKEYGRGTAGIKTLNEIHFTLPTAGQQSKDVIFLRHRGIR